jgi:hypothetical protein
MILKSHPNQTVGTTTIDIMKKIFGYTIVCAALLAACQGQRLFAQATETSKETPMGRVETVRATLTAEVTAINLSKREVTLKGPQGNEVTITAGKEVKRLDEVKVGDFVRVDYLVSVAAEIRKPTAEEAKHPLVIMAAGGKTPEGEAPAAGVARRFKVVTTIEVLIRPEQTVTVKGPMGHYLTARVADPKRLTKVHIGDTVVIVFTEALAVSLEKVEKKSE